MFLYFIKVLNGVGFLRIQKNTNKTLKAKIFWRERNCQKFAKYEMKTEKKEKKVVGSFGSLTTVLPGLALLASSSSALDLATIRYSTEYINIIIIMQ